MMTFFSTFFSCANGYPMLLGGPFFEGTMRTWTGFSLQWECHVMSLVSCDQAFIEQRKHEKNQGHRVGPMTLFFGGRHAHAEYYYRDEPGTSMLMEGPWGPLGYPVALMNRS